MMRRRIQKSAGEAKKMLFEAARGWTASKRCSQGAEALKRG